MSAANKMTSGYEQWTSHIHLSLWTSVITSVVRAGHSTADMKSCCVVLQFRLAWHSAVNEENWDADHVLLRQMNWKLCVPAFNIDRFSECLCNKAKYKHTDRLLGHYPLSYFYLKYHLRNWRPPLWSSGQSSWQQIHRSQVRFLELPDFLGNSGCGTGSTQPREDNGGAIWMEK
jgi:hypothetical protein